MTRKESVVIFLLLATGAWGFWMHTHYQVPIPESDPTPMLTEAQIDERLAQAEALFTQGEYQKTIDLYQELIAHDPTNVDWHLEIAHVYRYWYKYPQSEEWFLKAIELNPANAHSYNELGKLYRNMGRYDDAETAFVKSISLEQNSPEVYSYGLGYLYLEQDRYDEAEAMFTKALELAPEDSFTYMGFGDLYRETHEYSLSEEMFKKSLSLYPQSEARYGLGILYEHQERYNEAVESYLSFIHDIREKGEVYNALARVYVKQGKLDEALSAVDKAIALNPENPIFIEHKGYILADIASH